MENSNNINEELIKEEEIMNTIKMEPIIEKTEIKEEKEAVKKRKMMKATDYALLIFIVLLIFVFAFVVIKLK